MKNTVRLLVALIILVVLALESPADGASAFVPAIESGFATIELDGNPIRIHYLHVPPADASAPFKTLMFFHGLPTSNAIFGPVMDQLSQIANVETYAISFPGFGRSDAPAPAGFDYTETGLNRVPFKVADALGVERFVGVVHDVGGPWFLCPATEPQNLARLQGLVVLNSGTSTPDHPAYPLPGMQRFGVLLGNLSVPRFFISRQLRNILQAGTAQDVVAKFPGIVREIQVANSETSHRLAISKVIEEAANDPLGFGGTCAGDVGVLNVLEPLLLWAPPNLWGGFLVFSSYWPDAAAVFVSDAGHWLMLDQEEAVATAIAGYISGQEHYLDTTGK